MPWCSFAGHMLYLTFWDVESFPNPDNWGVGAYSYICVLPDGFISKVIVFMVCEHEYINITHPNYRVELWPCWCKLLRSDCRAADEFPYDIVLKSLE